jgi:hypothetical protein
VTGLPGGLEVGLPLVSQVDQAGQVGRDLEPR